ncbi:MAG: UbiA family prenyltransferase [Bryobacteraceae bacterium]
MKAVAERRLVDSTKQSLAEPPLAVDLDGTLVRTDLLLESLLALLKRNALYVCVLPLWLVRGKAYFKQQIARRVSLDVTTLPYRQDLLDDLKAQRGQGRRIVLATACDVQIAGQVADHLKLFDAVFASDGIANLSGEAKRKRLVSEFGEKGFDYAGDHRNDRPVWASARKAIVVQDPRPGLVEYLKPLRPQHWLKNILIFVPLLAAQRFLEPALLEKAILAFISFGCLASSGYLLNDLFDLASDRHHPHKRLRPFAAGNLPLSFAVTMFPVLIAVGCVIGLSVSPLFLAVLLTYLALTTTYSFFLRKIVLLDVIILAGLYTMRLMAGSAAVGIWPSHWLLAFSTFLFFSLALVKRYGELVVMRKPDGAKPTGRGYEQSDGELLAAMGVASGYLAVLVLALYINSDAAQTFYGRYQLIWFQCPLLFYWISHVWLIAHRGQMPDDPVVFSVSDRTSLILALLMLAVTLVAL